MIVTHLKAKNWRNFRGIDVDLCERQFIVGPNASGKSNFLDIFSFLRDIAKSEGGGLQKAINNRLGVSNLRNLAARKDPEIAIEISLGDRAGEPASWRYGLGIRQRNGRRMPHVSYEHVWRGEEQILNRPNREDNADEQRLTQTYLEQVGANADFREISGFLQTITHFHMVPQLLRNADVIQGRITDDDPFSQSFLDRIARTTVKTRKSRLRLIEKALKNAVPQLQGLQFAHDDLVRPHLEASYSHWRPDAGWQRENQFSDGTLRLIGFLWSLLESESMLLVEEPEQSLNSGIVAQLAPIIHSVQKRRRRQVLISTHSSDLLGEPGIDGREVLMLTPGQEGTEVCVASDVEDIRALLEAGFTAGEVILPRSNPTRAQQLSLAD